MNSRVSVIIPVFNYGRYVAEAIESVFDQVYKDFELIVVDDGSTDNTPNVVRKYGGRLTYIRQQNSGVAQARNRGIRESKGELLAFLDADDRWTPDKLSLQVQAIDANPDAGVVYTATSLLFPTGETVRDVPTYPRYPKSGWVLPYLLQGNFITTSTALVRRICIESAGMFKRKYIPCEDYDLWLRIASKYPVIYIDRPTVLYRVHAAGLSSQERLRFRTWEIVQSGLARYRNVPEVAAQHRKILRANVMLNSQLALDHNALAEGLSYMCLALWYPPTSYQEWRFFCRSLRKLAACCYRVSKGNGRAAVNNSLYRTE